MAKAPSLRELIEEPSRRRDLSTLQAQELLDEVKGLIRSLGGATDIPSDPATFAAKFSRGRWVPAPHLILLSKWLVELEQGKRSRIVVMLPPRHGKSEFISFWYPLWRLVRHPERRVILVSYEEDQAANYGRRVRSQIIEYGNDLGLRLDMTSRAANRWNLDTGGGMISAGVKGPITGKGADLLIVDDPIKNQEEASSETIRNAMWEWWQTVPMTRLEPGAGVVVLGTRWHEDDLLGRLVNQNKEGTVAWDVLSLPAIAEEEDPLGRAVGEPLWPVRFDSEALEEKRKGMSPYHFSALYQQSPTPEAGNSVKRSWWKWYEQSPASFDQVIQSWDLAQKDLAKNDFTVGQVWGRRGAEFYLLHQVRERMNPMEAVHAIRNVSLLFPDANAKVIEDAAAGPAVIAMLQHEVSGIIPWPPKGRKRTNKEQRLVAEIPKIEAGNVYLPTYARWAPDLVEEFAAFPNAMYDDQVDAATQALNYMSRGGWAYVSRAHKEAHQGPGGETIQDIHTAQFHASMKKRVKRNESKLRRFQRDFRVQ